MPTYDPTIDNSPITRVTQVDTTGQPANTTTGSIVSLGTLLAGEDLTNNRMLVRDAMTYTNLTADTLIKTGAGVVAGFIINSHTSGTVKLWDNTSAATTTIMNTFTPAAGSGIFTFPKPIRFVTGLYCDIGGTIDLTIIWE